MSTGSHGPTVDFVVPRFGPTVVGGAETLGRLLATNLAEAGVGVRILTTCAIDHFTWANVLPAGVTRDGALEVHRFPVGPRDSGVWSKLHAEVDVDLPVSYADQVRWMANSVWSPQMLQFITGPDSADWTVAMPYLFGTSIWTVAARPERTVLIPCLHNEPHARSAIVAAALGEARGLMFNSETERQLAYELMPQDAATRSCHTVVGVGYDDVPVPNPEDVQRFASQRGIATGYLLYAGRREEAKGLNTLFRAYRAYLSQSTAPRPLALMGSGSLPIPDDVRPHVIDLGFVDQADMPLAYAGALVLVHPSRLESLGMVMLEAWLTGTPALVTEYGPVLMEHCRASGGGLWWADDDDFTEVVEALATDPQLRNLLGANGREYVRTQFSWSEVRDRFLGALEAWA